MPADGVDRLFRQHVQPALERRKTGRVVIPGQRSLDGGQDALHGLGHFRANAVSGNQCDRVFHAPDSTGRLDAMPPEAVG